MSDRRDPDDLRDVLEDLRRTLDDLEAAVDRDGLDDDRKHDREHGRVSRRGDREPPRGSDVVRFTETYTIPTVISVLETTIQSLELLRGVLRLADPDRREESRRASRASVDRRVVEGTERALDDLRRALTGEEFPPDPVAGEVLGEARALTSEIESLLREQRPSGAHRSERPGVVIPVDDGNGNEDEVDGENGNDDTPVNIDIDAELASIKDEVQDADGEARDHEEEESGVAEDNDDGVGEGRAE